MSIGIPSVGLTASGGLTAATGGLSLAMQGETLMSQAAAATAALMASSAGPGGAGASSLLMGASSWGDAAGEEQCGRRAGPASLVQMLRAREQGRFRGSPQALMRRTYESVAPDTAYPEVQMFPAAIPRKFTSCGNYLVCLSRDLRELCLYRFKFHGIHEASRLAAEMAAAEALAAAGEAGPVDGAAAAGAREGMPDAGAPRFDDFFDLVYSRKIPVDSGCLCKDFLLSTGAGDQYLVLASSVVSSGAVADPPAGHLAGVQASDDYTFHVVETRTGVVLGRRVFANDHIQISGNAGVSIHAGLLSVLSIRNQTIHMLQITSAGELVDVRKVGQHCLEDDELELSLAEMTTLNPTPTAPEPASESTIISRTSTTTTTTTTSNDGTLQQAFVAITTAQPAPPAPSAPTQQPASDEPKLAPAPGLIVGLKHKVLAYMYKLHAGSSRALLHFYHLFPQYESLVMWKASLLDERHLLVKFGSVEGVTLRGGEGLLGQAINNNNNNNLTQQQQQQQQQQLQQQQQTYFFAVYNFVDAEVVSVHDNSDERFLEIFERHFEWFVPRPSDGPLTANAQMSTAITAFSKERMQRQKEAMLSAKSGGRNFTTKRILIQVPLSPQAISDSPYFDSSLFTYDERIISSSDRLKPCSEHPVKFHSRRTNAVVFKVTPGGPMLAGTAPRSRQQKRLVSYLFHPTMPFAISILQTLTQAPVVSFHLPTKKI
jgi:de-etiolated-1